MRYKILKLQITLNPKFALVDFETAASNALKYHFPDVEIKGSWYHFRQAIMKRVTRLGSRQPYHQTEYAELNRLGALAFIPVDLLDDAMQIIERLKPTDTKYDQLLDYFKRTWLKRNTRFLHQVFKYLIFRIFNLSRN